MLKSHTIDQDIIKLQLEVNKLPFEMRSDDPELVNRMAEREAKQTKLLELYSKLGEARETESREMEVAMSKFTSLQGDGWTPELRELHDIAKQVGLNDYMLAARDGRPVTGAAAEYNSHVFGHNAAGDFPVELLGDRAKVLDLSADDWNEIKDTEHRAAVTGTGVNPGATTNYISQLFATSEAAFCGASFPAVGVGDHSYPIFSKSLTAGDFARDATEPESSGSLTINTATNRRLQSSMVLTSEDENRIPNIAGGLVNHLRAGLQETLDNYVIDALSTALVGTDVDATTTTETLSLFLRRVGSLVNGIGARNVGEVRGLLNAVPAASGTLSLFSLLSGLSLAAGGSHFWELPRLSDPNYFRGSAHLLPATAAVATAIFTRIGEGVNLGRLQVPIWRRAQMLRDTGVGQLRGRIQYTVAMFAAVEVTATDQHVLHHIDIA